MILMITYDLNKGKDYTSLYKAIDQLGQTQWDPGLDSVRFVSTTYTPTQASNFLRNYIDKDDRLFIVKVNAGQRDGWLLQNLWDWISLNE